MRKFTLIQSLLLLLQYPGWTQETKSIPTTSVNPIPVTDARRPNPVRPTPQSIAEGKKIYGHDCALCHGEIGDGITDPGLTMKIPDLADPSVLKGFTDGGLFFVIQNGRGEMPPEGDRVKAQEIWDLVNYVRFLATKKAAFEEKPSN